MTHLPSRCRAPLTAACALLALAAAPGLAQSPGEPEREPPQVGAPKLKVKKQVNPKYPREAMEQGLVGSCTMRLFINPAGVPVRVIPERCPEVFRAAAVEAASQWRFYPVQMEGQATEADFVLKINFQIRGSTTQALDVSPDPVTPPSGLMAGTWERVEPLTPEVLLPADGTEALRCPVLLRVSPAGAVQDVDVSACPAPAQDSARAYASRFTFDPMRVDDRAVESRFGLELALPEPSSTPEAVRVFPPSPASAEPCAEVQWHTYPHIPLARVPKGARCRVRLGFDAAGRVVDLAPLSCSEGAFEVLLPALWSASVTPDPAAPHGCAATWIYNGL